jgi:hypothetical protein
VSRIGVGRRLVKSNQAQHDSEPVVEEDTSQNFVYRSVHHTSHVQSLKLSNRAELPVLRTSRAQQRIMTLFLLRSMLLLSFVFRRSVSFIFPRRESVVVTETKVCFFHLSTGISARVTLVKCQYMLRFDLSIIRSFKH